MSVRDSIVGHARAVEILDRIATSGRVPNALALAGPDGVGKRRAALALFRTLNGLSDAADVAADADLVDLRAVAAAFGKAAPTHFGKAAPAQIDAVREVKRRIALAPFRPAGWRMVLVEEAEALSEPAANALLKSVEEPSPRTFFVLLVAALDRLLPTLRSRSAVVRFGPLSDDETVETLRRSGLPTAEARRVAALAPGRPGRALALASGEGPALRDAFVAAARDGLPVDVPDRLDRGVAAAAAALVVEEARHRLRTAAAAADGPSAAGALEALEAALDAADDVERGVFAPLALDAAAARWSSSAAPSR